MEAIATALVAEMRRNERVVAIETKVSTPPGTPDAFGRLREEFGARRAIVVDSPELAAAACVGAAAAGLRPVARLGRLHREGAILDVLVHAAELRQRSGGSRTCPLTLLVGTDDEGDAPMALTRQPGLVVVAPATLGDAGGMLRAALHGDDPVVYVEEPVPDRAAAEEATETDWVDLRKAAVRRAGSDLTAVCHGRMLGPTLEAARVLATEGGAAVEVIDLRVLNPVDVDTVMASVAKTGRVVLVQAERRMRGVGAEIAATVAERAFDCLDAPIMRITAPDVPVVASGSGPCGAPRVEDIVSALRKLLAY